MYTVKTSIHVSFKKCDSTRRPLDMVGYSFEAYFLIVVTSSILKSFLYFAQLK